MQCNGNRSRCNRSQEYHVNYNTREAADRLNVSVSFLEKDRLRSDPRIPFIKFGKLVRYREWDLAKYEERLSSVHSAAALFDAQGISL